jgi:hypothetical protein
LTDALMAVLGELEELGRSLGGEEQAYFDNTI